MKVKVMGDRVHVEPVRVRKSGSIDLGDKGSGVFWRVRAVGSGVYADSIVEGDIVVLREGIGDAMGLSDGSMLMGAHGIWCALRGDRVCAVGPRVAIEADADPEEAATLAGIILLRHDRDFPTLGYADGERVAFNNKSHQLRLGWAGKLWVVGDRADTLVGWV